MTLFNRFTNYMNDHPLRVLAWWLLLTLTLVFALAAHAGTASLTWTHPTQYTDNTPIAAGAITATEINYGACNAAKTGLLATPAPVVVSVAYPAAARDIMGLAPGDWCFQARTIAGSASAWTAFVNKTIVQMPPQPPSNLTVTQLTVYHIQKREDRFVLLPVGTVPADTVCDPTQSVNGYFVVPRAAVIWSGTVKPPVVVASCS